MCPGERGFGPLLRLWVGFPQAQSHSGVNWPASLARQKAFEMHPPLPPQKG